MESARSMCHWLFVVDITKATVCKLMCIRGTFITFIFYFFAQTITDDCCHSAREDPVHIWRDGSPEFLEPLQLLPRPAGVAAAPRVPPRALGPGRRPPVLLLSHQGTYSCH